MARVGGGCKDPECFAYPPSQSVATSKGTSVVGTAGIVAAVEIGNYTPAEALAVGAFAAENCSGRMGSTAASERHCHRMPAGFVAALATVLPHY